MSFVKGEQMSHFAVLVVVPKNDDWESNMEDLLKPYSENLEVPEYEKSCYCVDSIASNEARIQTESVFGELGNIRKAFFERDDIKKINDERISLSNRDFHIDEPPLSKDEEALLKKLNDDINKEYEIATAPYNDYMNKIHGEHPMHNKANPDCSECNGTGVRMTTYNPDSKWDWYGIGGRWHNFLNLGDNIADIPAIIKAFEEQNQGVYAIVTPDGVWHEKGEMGWWGISRNENEDWDKDMLDILKDYNSDEYIGIVVDCHI